MNATTTPEPEAAPERDAVAEIREALRKEGWTPERAQARSAAFRELQHLHPRMYALIRERWDGDALAQPYLLAVAATHGELRRVSESLPADQLDGASICYVFPAGTALGY